MPAIRTGPGGLVQTLRRRVRLRTRLRRAAAALRQLRPRRLPRWPDPDPDPAGPVVTRADGQVEITVESPEALRELAGGAAQCRSLRLTVTDWRTPHPGWSGRLGPLPGLVRQEISLPVGGRGPVTVVATLATPVELPRLVAAVVPALLPARPLPRPASADQPVAASVDRPAAATAVVVDPVTANPRGRNRYGPRRPAGRLTVPAGTDRWEIIQTDGAAPVVAGRVGEPLLPRQSAVLAELGAVTCAEPANPATLAPVLAQLASTGLVLHVPASPAGLLAPELADLLREPLPGPGVDPLEWELRSVAQRRAALRHHAAGLTPPAGYPGLARLPSVSALLVTRRPNLVVDAVAAMARQTYPELEIVVALHGADPPPELDRPGPVLTVPPDWTLGEALGAATRAASGSLVTKVDDDDRYGPEHLWDLVLARHYSGATVVGKGAEFVYLAPKDLTVRRRMASENFTDTVAGGTILLSRGDLEAVGGWPPVPKSVDRGLLDRVLAAGGLVYRTHPLGFLYTRHGDGHTWDPGLDYFLTDPARTWPGLPPYEEFGN